MELLGNLVAVLFYRAEPLSFSELQKILSATRDELISVRETSEQQLDALGLTLVMTDDTLELRTNQRASVLIDQLRKEELTRDLGKAGLETLSILLYRGPATRADIEYIRGVNSSAILRNLLIRGLVERVANPKDQRSFLYKPTGDMLAHLGISEVKKLPDFDTITEELRAFEIAQADTQ